MGAQSRLSADLVQGFSSRGSRSISCSCIGLDRAALYNSSVVSPQEEKALGGEPKSGHGLAWQSQLGFSVEGFKVYLEVHGYLEVGI